MKPRSLAILVGIGAVALVGGWYLGPATAPKTTASVGAGQLAFPGLAARLADATKLTLEQKGKTLVIEKHDGHWGVADRGDYPVQADKLRGVLAGLTELRLVARRTSDPAQFGALGVDDPAKPDTTGLLLQVLDQAGKPIVSEILGHRRVLTGGNVPQQIYVRAPGSDQSWLAEGTLEVDADASLWLDRDIADIHGEAIAAASVTNGTEHLTFARQGDKFVLTAPADHPPLDDYKVGDVSRAFAFLTFDNVRPGPPLPGATLPGTPVGTARFTTTDGETIDVTMTRDGKNVWASFTAAGNAAGAKLDARVKGWAYELGGWKSASLVPSLADLKADTPATPPHSAPPPPTSPPPTSDGK